MIFAHTYEQVLKKTKTRTTRRLYTYRGEDVPCRYQVGKTYAIQAGRGGRAIGRIEVLEVQRLDSLRGIDGQYAVEEGFETVDAFLETYRRVNGTGLDEPVYSIRFKLVEAA